MQMEAAHIVVAGAGGNTGSHLLAHIARIPRVAGLTLVDPDTYEPANLAVQNIDAADLGQPKVVAQAARLGRIRPDLAIAPIQARVEDVPRGLLRCDLFVSCLDSRAARQHLSEIAWHLGTPLIDCGVLGGQNLARMTTWTPAPGSPCIECAWGPEDYALLGQEYLCGGERATAFPTGASSDLGALAASLVALELARFLCHETLPLAREVIFDAEHRVIQTTQERCNRECRFDHAVWRIDSWLAPPSITTLAQALRELGTLRIEGHRFISELVCPGCGRHENLGLRLNRPLARCAACNRRMASAGFGARDFLDSALAAPFLDLNADLTLDQIGIHAGDMVSCGDGHRQIVEAA